MHPIRVPHDPLERLGRRRVRAIPRNGARFAGVDRGKGREAPLQQGYRHRTGIGPWPLGGAAGFEAL